MFFSTEILGRKKGGFSVVWLAATLGPRSGARKLSRRDISSVNVKEACDQVITPPAPMALRLQSNLMLGVTRVYNQQYHYYGMDVTNVLYRLRHMNDSAAAEDAHVLTTPPKPRTEAITLADITLDEINANLPPGAIVIPTPARLSGGRGAADRGRAANQTARSSISPSTPGGPLASPHTPSTVTERSLQADLSSITLHGAAGSPLVGGYRLEDMSLEEGGFGDEGADTALLFPPPITTNGGKRPGDEQEGERNAPATRKRPRPAAIDETRQLSHARMRDQLTHVQDIMRTTDDSSFLIPLRTDATSRFLERREWTALLAWPALDLPSHLHTSYRRSAFAGVDLATQASKKRRAADDKPSPPGQRRRLGALHSSSSAGWEGEGGFGGDHDNYEMPPPQHSMSEEMDIGRALVFATPSPARRALPWIVSSSSDPAMSPSAAALERRQRTPSTAGSLPNLTPRRESGRPTLPLSPTNLLNQRLGEDDMDAIPKETAQFLQYIAHASAGVGHVVFSEVAPHAAGRSVGAEAFFQTLVLASAGFVRPEQTSRFGSIRVHLIDQAA